MCRGCESVGVLSSKEFSLTAFKNLGALYNICYYWSIVGGFLLKGLNAEVLPFKLSDIGEGIAEVTIKEW